MNYFTEQTARINAEILECTRKEAARDPNTVIQERLDAATAEIEKLKSGLEKTKSDLEKANRLRGIFTEKAGIVGGKKVTVYQCKFCGEVHSSTSWFQHSPQCALAPRS